MNLQRLTPFEIVSANLADLLALPDAQAAESLNARMAALDYIDQVHEISYSQRLVIIREFERRSLWKHLIDPRVGQPFPHLTAWLSSGFIGCRRVNMEAHSDLKKLAEIPAEKLVVMPKENIKTLTQLSTSVQRQPDVIEAAGQMPAPKFDEKIEKEYPEQHREARKPLHIMPSRTDRKDIDAWIKKALEKDIAGTVAEAITVACRMALHDVELDEELESMSEPASA